MALEPSLVEFAPDDTSAVVDAIRPLAEAHGGWVNLHPLVPEDEVPRNTMGLFGWVSARGPAVPQATWVAGEVRRGTLQPDSIGLQHPAGPKARARLADVGVPVPEGWRVRADHPRRGLVADLPAGEDLDVVVGWLVRAARALSGRPLTDAWVAAIYRP